MSDQADGLRQLVRALGPDGPGRAAAGGLRPGRRRSLVLTSGKGGVGTSNLALNLAIALGEEGQRVVLVDADLGLANIDLLCGLTPAQRPGRRAGRRVARWPRRSSPGPADIRIVPGAHGMRTPPEVLGDAPARLAAELAELEAGADFVLVDAGSGLGPGSRRLAAAADEVVVVTTPEPTARGRRPRRDRPAPAPPVVRAAVAGRGQPGAGRRAEAERGAGPALRRRAGSSSGRSVTALGTSGPTRRCRWPSGARSRSWSRTPHSTASRDVRRLARVLLAEQRPAAGSAAPASSPPWRPAGPEPRRLAGRAGPSAGKNVTTESLKPVPPVVR